jgi:hypothetical protein
MLSDEEFLLWCGRVGLSQKHGNSLRRFDLPLQSDASEADART